MKRWQLRSKTEKKSGIKLSLERPNLLDFVNLSQIFFDGL